MSILSSNRIKKANRRPQVAGRFFRRVEKRLDTEVKVAASHPNERSVLWCDWVPIIVPQARPPNPSKFPGPLPAAP